MNQQEARERVQRGAALLDEKRPGWAEQIDTRTLDMSSGCLCVIGQVIGHYDQYRMVLPIEMGCTGKSEYLNFNIDHGFFVEIVKIDSTYLDYRQLQDAWIEAIAERLTPPLTWTHRPAPETVDA